MKKQIFGLALVFFACASAGSSGNAWAQTRKNATSGKPLALIQFPFVDKAACTLASPGRFIFDKQPTNGRVEVREVKAQADHRTCGRIKGIIPRIVYTSRTGYTGPDMVEFLLIIEPENSDRGARETRTYRIPIDVQQKM